jgi:hypothetical protein
VDEVIAEIARDRRHRTRAEEQSTVRIVGGWRSPVIYSLA